VLDGLEHVVGGQIEDADPDPRVLRVEVLDHPRQEIIGRGRHRRDRHLARGPVRELADAEHGGIQLVQEPLRLEEEVPADGAQAELPRVALEQLRAERRFELLDAAGQRRLRQVQRVRRGVETALLDHGDEAAQAVHVVHHARHAFHASFVQIIAFY
jgi:hypothetical protein